jgi:hypothetical protein
MKGLDGQSGAYYMLDKTITVAASTTAYSFDTRSACQLNLSHQFNRDPCDFSYEFKRQGSIFTNRIGPADLPAGTVYAEKGVYEVKAVSTISGIANNVEGIYSVDCSSTSAALVVGGSIRATFTPNKSTYDVGNKVGMGSVRVYDGNVELTGFTTGDFIVMSMDLMHGDRVIKNLGNAVTNQLNGECTIRLYLGGVALGSVVTGPGSIKVNNPSFKQFGDINLNSITDIFDLVLISSDFGKQRSVSPDWDGRCNIYDSDSIIDIKDIAKAAQYYNSRY